jgi:hypothetical protein
MFDDVQAKTNKDIKDMAQIVEEEEDDEWESVVVIYICSLILTAM